MSNILGFEHGPIVLHESPIVGKYGMSVLREIPQQLFVTTDIIHHQLIGGSYEQVLRSVYVDHSTYVFGCMAYVNFKQIHYYPVNHEKIDDIQIYIKDRFGKCISFDSGTLTQMNDPYTAYYAQQAAGRTGGSYHGVSQKGDGLGSFLGGLFRRIFPLISSGAKAVGKEALSTGINLLKDALNGRPIKESMYDRVKQAGTNLTTKGARTLESMVGNGYKRGKRKRRAQSRSVVKKKRKVVRRARKPKRKKKVRRDIFG
ncbi:hypothetical protein B566_EDAN018054 [Ephemera danica]|nr:hypothetical protein B566_EDAN018054 [Ephemera danica]